MTSGRRDDLIILALLLSLVAHVGIMTYARPQVMSHSAAIIAEHAKTGPMRITTTAKSVETTLATPEDAAATREAPKAESVTGGVGAEALPMEPSSVEQMPPEPPKVEAAAIPDPTEAAPEKMESAGAIPVLTRQVIEEPAVMLVTPEEASAPVVQAAASEGELVAAPDFAMAVPTMGSGDSSLIAAAPARVEAKPVEVAAFTPAAEVFDSVDEKVVEAEKAAVKALVDVPTAAPLAKSVNVSMMKCATKDWTYFKVMIVPRSDLEVVPKDLVVLIDASGSIGSVRMKSLKEAAKAVLRSALNGGDRFNLVAFRSRFSYAFKTWQECTEKSFEEADDWLEDLTAHGRTDVFASIRSVLTLPRDPMRPLIAMVVTDGVANEGVSDNAELISKFTELNDGLVSIYMYGVKQQANRELIARLTRGNRGEGYVYEGARAAAGAEIGAFAERFRDPVLSDLRLVFAAECQAEAYPTRLRNLCRGGTVTVVGRVPSGITEVAFSLKGLNGKNAKEDFFRLPLATAADDLALREAWQGRVENRIENR